ncbi:O-antigen ligase family protein [Demequina pelophila]|uniref:O-antigen ligase family protein n=1 Tax=Demequina pelophila TaxID=1638984 RepID=UPI000782E37F|nr:hypothetical protein [Demequina pelophila]
MIDLVVWAGLLLVGSGAVCALGYGIARRPRLGMALMALLIALDYQFQNWPPLLSLGGIAISVVDVTAATLLLAAMLGGRGSLGARIPPFTRLAIAGIITMVLLSLVLGVTTYGLGPAANDARGWVYIVVIGFWTYRVSCGNPDWRLEWENWLLWPAAAVAVVGLSNIAMHGLGSASTQTRDAYGEVIAAGRPLTSHQAIFLAIGAVVLIERWRVSKGNWRLAGALVLGVMLVLAQHRSVWVAAAAMGLIVVLRSLGRRPLETAAALIAVASAAALSWRLILQTSLGSLLDVSASDTRTYEGRQYDWQYLMAERAADPVFVQLVGQPFGTSWERPLESGGVVTYAPHNWYVSTGLQLGALGAAALVLIIGGAVVRAMRADAPLPAFPVLLGLTAFFWTYNMKWFTTPVLVWAVLVTLKPAGDGGDPPRRGIARGRRTRSPRAARPTR